MKTKNSTIAEQEFEPTNKELDAYETLLELGIDARDVQDCSIEFEKRGFNRLEKSKITPTGEMSFWRVLVDNHKNTALGQGNTFLEACFNALLVIVTKGEE